MLKRYFSFFVLFLFLVNSVGFNLVTLLQLQLHRGAEAVLQEKVVDLQLSEAEINSPAFHWLEEDEFTFNGRMYDVIALKQEQGSYHFKCHDDTKETALYEELEEQNKESEHGFPAKNKSTSLKKGIEYDHAAFIFSFSSCHLAAQHFTNLALFAPVSFHSVASPPPWLV